MPITDNPTFLAVETRDGRANLGGRRRLIDDIDDAVETADEEDLQVFALEPLEVVDITPVAASAHVRLIDVPALAMTPELDPETETIS